MSVELLPFDISFLLEIKTMRINHPASFLLSLLASYIALPSLAQAPEIGGLLPSGGPRGQITHVRLDGKNLTNARLHFNGSGIIIKSQNVNPAGDRLTAELSIDPKASLGPHEVRISSSKGVSNGSRFWVDTLPNLVIDPPMQESAPPIELEGKSPIVINSRIAAKAGRDRYILNASAGDIWVFDCYADRIRSRFDPMMVLKNEAGISLKLAQSAWESDPHFFYRFAKTGKYFLTVHDSEYNGGTNYVYRMLTGRIPFIAGFSPRGGQPGAQVQLSLQGTNLPSDHVTLSIPATASTGTYWSEIISSTGVSLVLPLLVDSIPVTIAADSDSASPLPAMPCNVDGTFTRFTRNRFTFHATAKSKILFDLLGRRIGSRIDGEIRILDKTGKEIAENDDGIVLSKDARLEFTSPADGEYTLEVRNVEEITGPDCFYRLKATPVTPDFQISIETDRISIPAGGKIALKVDAEKFGGFDGPIEIKMENLPAGVVLSGGLIPAGKKTVDISLTADPTAKITANEVHLVGESVINGRKIRHDAPAWERYEHRSIDLGLAVEYSYNRPHHLWDMLLVAITEPAPVKK